MIVQPIRSIPLLQTLFFFRGHLAPGSGGFLLYRRNSYAQSQNRLRAGVAFIRSTSLIRLSYSAPAVALATLLDPMLLGASLRGNGFHAQRRVAQSVCRTLHADMIANRVVMILVAGDLSDNSLRTLHDSRATREGRKVFSRSTFRPQPKGLLPGEFADDAPRRIRKA